MSSRCSLCNSVSSMAIETNVGDFSPAPFWVDPKSPMHYICDSCHDEYQEQIVTYQEDDDLDSEGWSSMEMLFDTDRSLKLPDADKYADKYDYEENLPDWMEV